MGSLGAYNTAIAQLRSSAGKTLQASQLSCPRLKHAATEPIVCTHHNASLEAVHPHGRVPINACCSAGQNLNHGWKVPLLYNKYVSILGSEIPGRGCAPLRCSAAKLFLVCTQLGCLSAKPATLHLCSSYLHPHVQPGP